MCSFLPVARPALSRLFLLLLALLLAGPGGGWAQVPAWAQAVSLNPSGGSNSCDSRAVATDAAGNQYVTGSFNGTLVLGSTTLVSAGDNDVLVAKRSAATGAWLWAVRVGGSGYDYGSSVAVDAGGNALVTGKFEATAAFATSPAPTVLVSAGSGDVFVARFGAATGACTWAVGVGGSGSDSGQGVAVDAVGNALVTGIFQATATFATSPAPTVLAAAGSTDGFVAKFGAATGVCGWAVTVGGGNGNAVAVDAGGNAVVTGLFAGTATFATAAAPVALVAVGGADLFVAKFGAVAGVCVWAVQAGGSSQDYGTSVALDAAGNALVTGGFNGPATFATSPAPTALANMGINDIFVAKFGAAAGACAWAVRAGGSGPEYGRGVAVDGVGNALVTGYFLSPARFDTNPVPTDLVSIGGFETFVAKFGAASGACAWALRAGGDRFDTGFGVAVDAAGNAVVTGAFANAATFGGFALVGLAGSGSNYNATTGYVAVLAGAGTLPTATQSAAVLPAFTLFPNPARNACQIQGTAAGAAVILYDVLGRPLARALADASGTARLALPDGLAPGLYLVRSGGQVRRLAVE